MLVNLWCQFYDKISTFFDEMIYQPFILQARAINELAKKVFDVLKTNPEKFEPEFSETKRKVGRRNQGGFRDSIDIKYSEITIDESSKSVPCSCRGTSNRKSFKANHGCSDIAKHADGRDLEVPTGKRGSPVQKVDFVASYLPLKLKDDFPFAHFVWLAKNMNIRLAPMFIVQLSSSFTLSLKFY